MADSYRAFSSTSAVSVDTRSNISPTTSSPQALGDHVSGIDPNGFRGEWVWCIAGEALTAKAPLGLDVQDASVTLIPEDAYTVKMHTTIGDSPGRKDCVGLVDQACDSGKYVWVRVNGLVIGARFWSTASVAITKGMYVFATGNTIVGADNRFIAEQDVVANFRMDPIGVLMRTTTAGSTTTTADLMIRGKWL